MTPQHQKPQNFQQGWLDLLKRHGFAAGVAVYLIVFQGGRSSGQMDRIEARVEVAASAADRAASEQATVAAALIKANEQDRAQMRTAIQILRQICISSAHTDTQRSECLK